MKSKDVFRFIFTSVSLPVFILLHTIPDDRKDDSDGRHVRGLTKLYPIFPYSWIK